MQSSFVTSLRSMLARTARRSAEDLLPEIQRLLRALADVETCYEIRRERLQAWPGPEEAKERLAAQLDQRRCQERAPIVQRLDELEQQMRAAWPNSEPNRGARRH